MATMREETKRIWANILLLLTGAIWGGGFVVMKNALDSIPVNWLLVFRFSIGALGLSFSLFNKKHRITKALVGHCALIGFLMYAAFAAQTYGLGMTTAGKNALITAIYVVLVPLFGWYVNKKRPPMRTLAAAFIMLIGIALLSWSGAGGVNLGDVLTLLCGVFYALEIMAVDRYGADVDMLQF
ncbi:MAG: DMT family transporter, partial [Clostridia bacterium]|nr:DMT family transporter [Clostridia bacterium]